MEKPRAAPSERRRIEGLVADLRDPEDLARSAFLREIADAGLDRFHRISLSVEELPLDRLAEHAAVLLAATSGEHGRVQNALVRIEDVALGLVRPGHGRNAVTIVLAGEDGAALVEAGSQLRRALADAPDRDERVRVWFWSGGSSALAGAYVSMRRLDMPPLDVIRDNYPPPPYGVRAARDCCPSLGARRRRYGYLPPVALMIWGVLPPVSSGARTANRDLSFGGSFVRWLRLGAPRAPGGN